MTIFTNPASRSASEAKAYTTAVLELLGDQDPMRVLAATPDALRDAIAGLDARHVARPEREGKWSIAQVLQHLADSDLVWGWRLRLVLAQERPALTGYDQDAWAARLGYERANPEESLGDFGVLRRSNLRLLSRATPADLARVGVHTERGDESIAHMIRLYAGHDVLHLRQIARIREAVVSGLAHERQ
jgi:uncharacterized damage-inducible protein DinB